MRIAPIKRRFAARTSRPGGVFEPIVLPHCAPHLGALGRVQEGMCGRRQKKEIIFAGILEINANSFCAVTFFCSFYPTSFQAGTIACVFICSVAFSVEARRNGM